MSVEGFADPDGVETAGTEFGPTVPRLAVAVPWSCTGIATQEVPPAVGHSSTFKGLVGEPAAVGANVVWIVQVAAPVPAVPAQVPKLTEKGAVTPVGAVVEIV